MKEQFEILFSPLPRDHANDIERVSLADVTVVVNGHAATELEDYFAKTVRPSARLSVYRMALWFASNWWRLRWEPEARTTAWQMSHRLGGAGGGYIWPELSFAGEGSWVHIVSKPTTALPFQTIRYLHDSEFFVEAEMFEKGIDRFVEAVIGRLTSVGVSTTELQDIWTEVLQERRDPFQASWRKLEALLGFDPDGAPSALIEELQTAMVRQGPSAVEEIAAASKGRAALDLKALLGLADQASPPIRISNLRELIAEMDRELKPSQLPWQNAGEAARIAREVWAIETGPIENKLLADLFSFPKEWIDFREVPANVPMPAGFRVSSKPEEVKIVFRRKHPTGRRFEFARVIGDHLIARTEDKLLPITESKTERQKFQRAFAQELLCPFTELRDFMGSGEPGDEEIEEAAAYFEVSPLMIRTMLVNKGKLDRESLLSAERL